MLQDSYRALLRDIDARQDGKNRLPCANNSTKDLQYGARVIVDERKVAHTQHPQQEQQQDSRLPN